MIWERGSGLFALGIGLCAGLAGLAPARAYAQAAGSTTSTAPTTSVAPTAPAVAAAPADTAQSIDAKYADLIRGALAEMAAQHYLEARALFLKAHELLPSARTERGLGSVEFELQHYTWATLHFRAALTSGVRPLDQTMRKEVEQALARAESYTGYLHLTLNPTNGTIKIDGQPTTPAADGTIWLDIGDHELVFEAAGYQSQRQTVSIAGGERAELALTLALAPVAGPNAAVTDQPEAESPGLLSRWWFWTAAGVVVTGAVIGIAVASSGEETQPALEGNLGATQSVLRVRR
jgi:hypothetical protein